MSYLKLVAVDGVRVDKIHIKCKTTPDAITRGVCKDLCRNEYVDLYLNSDFSAGSESVINNAHKYISKTSLPKFSFRPLDSTEINRHFTKCIQIPIIKTETTFGTDIENVIKNGIKLTGFDKSLGDDQSIQVTIKHLDGVSVITDIEDIE